MQAAARRLADAPAALRARAESAASGIKATKDCVILVPFRYLRRSRGSIVGDRSSRTGRNRNGAAGQGAEPDLCWDLAGGRRRARRWLGAVGLLDLAVGLGQTARMGRRGSRRRQA